LAEEIQCKKRLKINLEVDKFLKILITHGNYPWVIFFIYLRH
jgi:hypothetical protein